MPDAFLSSRFKVERAEKHIQDLYSLLVGFGEAYPHTVTVEMDSEGFNWLGVNVSFSTFPNAQAAMIVGDALHNLRSSLDILWNEVIELCGGTPTRWSRFPIRDTADDLKAPLNAALENGQIDDTVYALVLNTIKPYKTGNTLLWALDDLNIRDKHQLLIPMLRLAWISGVCLKDDKEEIIKLPVMHADGSWRVHIGLRGRKLTVQDKGKISPSVFFRDGFPYERDSVSLALLGIAEEVTRTIETLAVSFPD